MGETFPADPQPKNDGPALATAYGRLNELLGENGQLRQRVQKLSQENEDLERRLIHLQQRCEQGFLHRAGYIGLLEDWVGRLTAERDALKQDVEPAAPAEPVGPRPLIAQELIGHGFVMGQGKEADPTLVPERRYRDFSGKESATTFADRRGGKQDAP